MRCLRLILRTVGGPSTRTTLKEKEQTGRTENFVGKKFENFSALGGVYMCTGKDKTTYCVFICFYFCFATTVKYTSNKRSKIYNIKLLVNFAWKNSNNS